MKNLVKNKNIKYRMPRCGNKYKVFKTLVKQKKTFGITKLLGKQTLNNYLECSMKKNDVFMVKYLLEHGADVNTTSLYGESVIAYAIRNNDMFLLTYLIERGAKLDLQLDIFKGQTELMDAVEFNDLIIVKYLIEHGADVNKQDNFGLTSLMYAIDKNNENVARYLINHGADVNKQDNKGITASMRAIRKNMWDIVNLIQKTNTIARARATDRVLAIKNKQYPKGVFPKDVARHIGTYVAFGKLPNNVKNKAKKLKIRLTVTRNGKRVYKTRAVLERQIKNKMK
jgi:ankyrin repeat protein